MLPMVGIDIEKAEEEVRKFKAIQERIDYDPEKKQEELNQSYLQHWSTFLDTYHETLQASQQLSGFKNSDAYD